MKKTSASHNSKKLSLAQFIWLGFNYTVGIAFVGNLATLSNYLKIEKNADGSIKSIGYMSDTTGYHILWIFILLGIIASVCALAFGKMSRIHKSEFNGGAYLYTRTAFGKFWGFITVFMQYVLLPFLISTQIFGLMKSFFSGEYAGETGMSLEAALGNHSYWAPIILDTIGILVYFFFAFVIFGGMKLFKRLSNLTGIIKWVTSGFLVIGAIFLAAYHGNGSQNYNSWFNTSWIDNSTNGQSFHLTFNAFTNAFTSCFFFYAGFETFVTAGKNIENPEKNIGKGILIIMLISTVFYISIILLFFGAVNPKYNPDDKSAGFLQNMNMGLWTMGPFAGQKIAFVGMGIMIFSQIALKANVSMQNALYGGTMLQPMSYEGYISEKYNELNQDDLPIKGSILNFYITGVVLLLWLIIPDLYQGIAKQTKPVFTISQLTASSSAITLFVYGIVILCLLKHAFNKDIKLKIWEWIVYPVTFALLALMLVYHYFQLFSSLEDLGSQNKDKFEDALSGLIELLFIGVAISLGVGIYFGYYKNRVWKNRQKSVEGRRKQEELDQEFVLINIEQFNAFQVESSFIYKLTSKIRSVKDVRKNQNNIEPQALAKEPLLDKKEKKIIKEDKE